MKILPIAGLLVLIFFSPYLKVIAQLDSYSVSGFVTDAVSGEELVGANILLYKDSINAEQSAFAGTSSNKFGFYSVPSLSKSKYELIVRYLGYKPAIIEFEISGNNPSHNISVQLYSEEIELEEVIVEAKSTGNVFTSTINLNQELLSKLPTLSGEVDLFKSLELLPGVNKGSELSSGLYVRGGSPDQTLTLIDGVIVYNPSHLGNIASTFNSNAISDVRLIKGAFPAEYGGRLSSVLDIKLRSGTKEKDKGKIGIGVINSFAAFEGPLGKKSTYMLSGRVMYYDVLQRNFNASNTIPRYNFFDLNAKVNYAISEINIISISGMYSKDNAYSAPEKSDTDYQIEWENLNLSLNWLQINTKSLLLNSIVSFIKYNFSSKIGVSPSSSTAYTYFSNPDLTDLYFRQNAEYKWHQDHILKLGFDIALHNYDILYSDVYSEALEKDPFAGQDITSTEASFYMQSESELTNQLKANFGGRLYYFGSSKLLKFEPRISTSFSVTPDFIINGAFAIAHQFLHLIVRNDVTLPTDLWYPSTKNILPSRSAQYVIGMDTYWFDQSYIFTVEGFYKDMKNLYEFKNSASLNPLNNSIEDQFTMGDGEAYGIEFFVNKRKGRFTGWIGYTLSFSRRQFDELNGGRIFYSKYDRRNDFSVAAVYNIYDNLSIGATWVYAAGQRYTLPPGQYIFEPIGIGGDEGIQFNYTGINTQQFPDYNKLDLNAAYKFKWLNAEFDAYINIYNVYNRHNTFAQYVVLEKNEAGEEIPVVKRITLFPIIPSAGIAINF